MKAGFQCWFTKFGDIFVADGVVSQPKTGARITVGSGSGFSAAEHLRGGEELLSVPQASGATFIGGSGRNLILDGLVAGLSSGVKPTGFFRPYGTDTWRWNIFTLTVLGASSATISDGTNIIAELTTGGTAPVGDYASTTYGAATYNATTAFTLSATAEGGSVGIPDATVAISAGTAQGETYVSTGEQSWESSTDADWTIEIASDGTAELLHLTTVIATRAAGSKADPSGIYDATAAGMAAHNLTDAEPVDGEPWRALVNLIGKVPRVGFVYLEIIESAGELTTVNGPFFGSTIPAPATDTWYFQLAQSDGVSIEQDHTGALVWP